MEKTITYVGLDVHKNTIAVALAEPGKRGEVRENGKIANTPAALRTLVAKLTRSAPILLRGRAMWLRHPCVLRRKAAGDSDGSQPLILRHSSHP